MTTHHLLRDGEIIKPGDEYLADDAVTWKPVPTHGNEAGTGWVIGCPFIPQNFKPIRRKVSAMDGITEMVVESGLEEEAS